jgi:hypothetical protein
MNPIRSLSNDGRLNVTGLVLAAIGMLLEMGAGSELYPTISGPLILLVAAAIVAFRPGRWTGYIGLIIPLVLGLGLLVSALLAPAFFEQLTGVGNPGLVLGSLAHVVGLVAAVAGGIGLVIRRQDGTTQGLEDRGANAR